MSEALRAAGAGDRGPAVRDAGADRRPALADACTAWTLGELADAVGLALDEHVVAALNGDQITRDRELPLAAGDTSRSWPPTRAAERQRSALGACASVGLDRVWRRLRAGTSAGRWSSTWRLAEQCQDLEEPVLRSFIGGAGLGAWLMHECCPAGVDAAGARGAADVRVLAAWSVRR